MVGSVLVVRAGSAMLVMALLVSRGEAQDVCRFLPSGSTTQSSELDDTERGFGIIAKCTALYPEGQVTMDVFSSLERVRQGIAESPATDPSSTPRPIEGLGDSNFELSKDQDPPGNADSPVRYRIYFARGCAFVFVNAGGALGANYILDASGVGPWNARREWALATAKSVDALLKNESLCPGGAATTMSSPPAPPGGLGVTASCQVSNDSTGEASCSASPTDAKPDASITYTWTFDGNAQGTTGSELALSGVSIGDHTVTVIANDSTNQLTSSPQTVPFTRRSSPASGDGGGDSSDIPFVPIAITTIIGGAALGGLGWAIARKRGRSPASPLVPAGFEPLGAPPRMKPPSALPETPESSPPAKATPATPAPAPRLPPPRSALPGTETTQTFQPVPDAAAPIDSRKVRSEVWLEAATTSVRVSGDGTEEVVVTIVARASDAGLTVDASNEVTPSWTVSDPRRVLLTRKGGYCTLAVRGLHAGNVPATATIAFTGASSLGRPVRPVTVTVTIDPVAIEVRIKVVKAGFAETTFVTTLPDAFRSVRARVEGGRVHQGPNEPARLPVAFARCEASQRVGKEEWSTPVSVVTARDGMFPFALPAETVQRYLATAEYQIPSAIELSWTQEVLDAMRGYENAWLDFRHSLERLPGGKDYAPLDEPLNSYREVFASQLRDNSEDDFPQAVAGIHLLRANLIFANKYRNDVAAQRRVVDYTAKECLSSAFDVFVDFVDVAVVVFGWLKKAGSLVGSRTVNLLEKLLEGLRSVPGSGLASRAALFALQTLRVPVATFEEGVAELIGAAYRLAGETGISPKFIQSIESIGEDARELVDGELKKVAGDAFGTAWEFFLLLMKRVLFGGVKIGMALMHIAVLVLCAAGKTVATLMRELPWGEDSKWVAALLEAVEDKVGDLVSSFYEGFGLVMDALRGRFFWNKLIGVPASALSKRNLADIVLDAVTTLAELDRKSALEMKRAYEKAAGLGFGTDWHTAVREVSAAERRVMLVVQQQEKLFYDIGFVADVTKLAMKLLQAIVFTWNVSSIAVLKVLRWGAYQIGDAGRAFTGTLDVVETATSATALAFQQTMEKVVDLCDLLLVRAPILMVEVGALYFLTEMGPSRMRALIDKANVCERLHRTAGFERVAPATRRITSSGSVVAGFFAGGRSGEVVARPSVGGARAAGG